ncbi:MAG: ribonuclease HIII [Firmicutes bacterium]|jgi:ribonuclease HIII|nr:ribonuclease HIII [Bacillota bacterium]
MGRWEPGAEADAIGEFARSVGWQVLEDRQIQSGRQVTIAGAEGRVSVAIYGSGKGLVQGGSEGMARTVEAWWKERYPGRPLVVVAGSRGLPRESRLQPVGTARVGVDESGKGDYFGPLVVAAVFVDPETEKEIIHMGVRDSKRLSAARIGPMAVDVASACPHSVVVIGPKRYNELYAQMQNVNRVLAWGHARSLENVLTRVDAGLAVADQFGDRSYLEKALMSRGRQVRLQQRPRAEEDPAVAAASILARAEFLRRLAALSAKVGMDLPPGASDPRILEVARQIVADNGEAVLAEVAKVHFRTTRAVLPG